MLKKFERFLRKINAVNQYKNVEVPLLYTSHIRQIIDTFFPVVLGASYINCTFRHKGGRKERRKDRG